MIPHDHLAHPTALSLCSGLGGLDLAASQVLGARVVGYVERDAYCQAVLLARMEEAQLEPAPLFSDLWGFDCRPWRGAVDLVMAGFPCQPFSTASRGRKVAEDLWPEVFRVINGVAPRYVFLENVSEEAIARAAWGLGERMYRHRVVHTDSAEVGAPHRRDRWWLFAYPDHESEPGIRLHDEVAGLPETPGALSWEEGPDHVLGMDDGISSGVGRSDALHALGNCVVPEQAVHALRLLLE